MRQDPRHVAIPVIVVSAYTQLDSTVIAFQMGADDFVSKPFHPPDLLSRIAARVKHPHVA